MTSPLVLILTCSKPYYQARLRANHATFERLRNNGFRPVILRANPALTAPLFEQDVETGYELLTVPTDETYSNLSNKMSMAYRALWNNHRFAGAPGILKMDDNTVVTDDDTCQSLMSVIREGKVDYAGVSHSTVGSGPHRIKAGNRYSPIFNHLSAHFPRPFKYFGGSLYYLSATALHYLQTEDLEYPFEDVAVGAVIGAHSDLLVADWSFRDVEKTVLFGSDTESEHWTIQKSHDGNAAGHPPSTVRIGLTGRLGNQLFQVATTLVHAKKHCRKPMIYAGDVDLHPVLHQHILGALTDEPISNPATSVPFRYMPIPDHQETLIGYYQSSRYFTDIGDAMRLAFASPLPKHRSCEVAVHVRRGDYVGNRVHDVLDADYFKRAMAMVREIHEDAIFTVFCDDIAWAEEQFPDATVLKEEDPMTALRELSRFKTLILSNSTFSWWGAYLAGPVATVYAPDRWFGPAGPQDYEDVYERHWCRLSVPYKINGQVE